MSRRFAPTYMVRPIAWSGLSHFVASVLFLIVFLRTYFAIKLPFFILNPAFFLLDLQRGPPVSALVILVVILIHSAAFGFLGALAFRTFVKPPPSQTSCPHCEYELRGHGSGEVRCPECGRTITIAPQLSSNPLGGRKWNAIKTFDRCDQAVAAGTLWRAKEILQGNIGTQDFHPQLYERYGQLLLRMGDLIEAGKYLFLSGSRDDRYKEAITLFLDKHRRHPEHIFGALPMKAKWTPWRKLPPAVRDDMSQLGISRRRHRRRQAEERGELISRDYFDLRQAFILVVLAGIIVCFVVGLWTIGRALWTLVRLIAER